MTGALSWDIFCRVIDNYGDAAVCWRLALQLASEQQAHVRLWISDPETLHALCPEVAPTLPVQHASGIELRRWDAALSASERPGDVVVEAFGCGLPEDYLASMLGRQPPPLWITLEYLSAETWVAEHHGLPSPHPRLPLARYFFFPGFTERTGGVLHESALAVRKAAFGAAPRAAFWGAYGFDPPAAGALAVSLFAYANAPITPLLACWEQGRDQVVAAVPEGPLADLVREYSGLGRRAVGVSARRGSLEVRILPFVPQARYDELLWSCDFNFVRGEDSFVRAQWAECPFVWHAYPQAEGAHRLKLDAFLDLYAAGLAPPAAAALRDLWYAWNLMEASPVNLAEAWLRFRSHEAALKVHAKAWATRVAGMCDMATALAQFARQRVK